MNELYQISEVKLTYKTKIKKPDRIKIICSEEVHQLMKSTWDLDQIEHRETFKILLLNQANHVLGIYVVGEGGISSVNVDVRLIIQAAILANASAIIMVHNHPSNSIKPSKEDKDITTQVYEAAKLMNISLLDHIILNEDEYYSFSDQGILQ